MKLNVGTTYLLNIAPGWFVSGRVVSKTESDDGTGGYYQIADYTYCDFTSAPFTDALQDKGGKPSGLAAAQGVAMHKASDITMPSISDAMILQWFILDG